MFFPAVDLARSDVVALYLLFKFTFPGISVSFTVVFLRKYPPQNMDWNLYNFIPFH